MREQEELISVREEEEVVCEVGGRKFMKLGNEGKRDDRQRHEGTSS